MAKDSKDSKSKPASPRDAKTKTSSSGKSSTPSSRRPSGTTPSSTTSTAQRTGSAAPSKGAGMQRTNSGRQVGATPSTGAGMQRTNSGRQVGATPSKGADMQRTNSGRQVGATPSKGADMQRTNSGRQVGTTPSTGGGMQRTNSGRQVGTAQPTTHNASRAAPGAAAPAAAKVLAANANSSAYGAQGGSPGSNQGSMYGMGGGSMYGGAGAGSQMPNSMYGAGGASAYGMDGQQPNSMYGGNQGSMYGMGGGSMYGMNSGYGSMGAGGMGGSQMGSMYGMGGLMMGGSMYGMNPMMGSMYGMGGPMMGGSMYGMNPMMGSMYGMGGPMMGGSMYGMNPMMGSMYGMGGPMMGGSMYGMGSMNSFGSYGGGSMYGSLGGGAGSLYYSDVGDSGAGPVGGFFSSCKGPMSNESDRLPVRALQLKEDNRRLVRSTKKAEEKERGVADKDGDKKDGDDKKGTDTKSRSVDDTANKDGKDGKDDKDAKDNKDGKASEKDGADKSSGNKSRSLDLAGTGGAGKEEERSNPTNAIVLVDPKADPALLKVDGNTITLQDASPFTALVVIKSDTYDMANSKGLADMVNHVAQGHNVSLIFFGNKDKPMDTIKKATADLIKVVAAKLGGDKEVKHLKFTSMAAATSSPHKGKDLFDKNAEKELQFASNPIFGSCVENLKREVSTDANGVDKVMKTVLDYKTAANELVVAQHVIQHSNAGSVYMSSLTMLYVRDPDTAEAVSIADDQKIPMHWLKTALGGTSCLTVIGSLSGDKKLAEEEARYLKAMGILNNKKNQTPRSGNVARFIEYTEDQVKKREETAANLKSPEDKTTLTQLVGRMRGMVKDAKELLTKPDSDPKMYPVPKHRDATEDVAKDGAKSKSRGIDATGAGGIATAVEPFTSLHRMAVVEGARVADVGNTVEITVAGSKKAYDVEECISMTSSDKAPGPSKEMDRVAGVFAMGCNVAVLGAECVPDAKPVDYKTWYFFSKLLVDMLSASSPDCKNEFQLYMSVVREREVLADLLAPSAPTKTPLVVAASPLFGPHVHNMTMRKLQNPADVQRAVQEALEKAESLMAVDNAMIVATAALKQTRKDDVVVASLLAVSAKDMRPFEGVAERDTKYSRSLFSYALGGPCSTELLVTLKAGKDAEAASSLSAQRKLSQTKTAVPRCGSVKEFLKYTKSNKARMAKKAEDATDPAERARAKSGLKRMEESERDHEALLKDPANTELKSYAPDDHGAKPHGAEEAAAKAPTPAAAAQQQRELPTKPASPSGAAAGAAPARSPKTASPQKAGATPAASSPARQTAANASPKAAPKDADGNELRPGFIAVVTEESRSGMEGKPGWSVAAADDKLTVTDVEGPHEFTIDEGITRPSRSVRVNSSVIDKARDHFLSGYNVSLLTVDARGSATSLELIDRTVRQVLGKADPNDMLFISLCALRERTNEVRDTLRPDSSFVPLTVSTSPLFGPSVTDATYDRLTSAQDFVRLMEKGLRICGENRACVILHLVLTVRKPAEDDTIVSSMMAMMCPGDVSLYAKALKVSGKARGLLQFAIGGPCHTIFAAGFPKNPVDDSCLAVAQIGAAIRAVPNTRSPGGSVRRFINHTSNALAQMKKAMDPNLSEEEKRSALRYESSVTGMINDCEAYIKDPKGVLPAVYQK